MGVDWWMTWSRRFRRFDLIYTLSTPFSFFLCICSAPNFSINRRTSGNGPLPCFGLVIWKGRTRGDNTWKKESERSPQELDENRLNGVVWFLLSSSSGIRSETLWRSSSRRFNDETEQIPAHPLPHLFELKPFFVCISLQANSQNTEDTALLKVIHSHESIKQHKRFDFFLSLFPLIKSHGNFSLH